MSAISYMTSATPLRMSLNGSTVAIPILAVSELDNVALGGLLVAAALGPAVLAAPLVGALLDRTRHPRAMIGGAGLVAALGLSGAALLGVLPTILVTIGLLAAGTAAPFVQGGMSSFVTEEIPGERRAYALDALSYNVSSVAGPALVAAATALVSARLAMGILVAAALLGAVVAFTSKLRPRPGADRSILKTIGAGLRHVTMHRPLMIVITSGAVTQLGQGALPITAVLLALDRAGNAGDGAAIMSVFALGGLAGGLLTAARPSVRLRPEVTMAAGFAAIGLLTLGAAIDWGLVWTMVVLGAAGAFTAPSLAAMLLLRQQQSPLALRGQVFTVAAGIRATASAAGAALAGIASGLGGATLILAIAVVWIIGALMLIWYPRDAAPFEQPRLE